MVDAGGGALALGHGLWLRLNITQTGTDPPSKKPRRTGALAQPWTGLLFYRPVDWRIANAENKSYVETKLMRVLPSLDFPIE